MLPTTDYYCDELGACAQSGLAMNSNGYTGGDVTCLVHFLASTPRRIWKSQMPRPARLPRQRKKLRENCKEQISLDERRALGAPERIPGYIGTHFHIHHVPSSGFAASLQMLRGPSSSYPPPGLPPPFDLARAVSVHNPHDTWDSDPGLTKIN